MPPLLYPCACAAWRYACIVEAASHVAALYCAARGCSNKQLVNDFLNVLPVCITQYYLTTQGNTGGGLANWVKKWTDLMTEVYKLPDVNGVRVGDYVIVDVLNEPDQSWIKCAAPLMVP